MSGITSKACLEGMAASGGSTPDAASEGNSGWNDGNFSLREIRTRFIDGLISFEEVIDLHQHWLSINQYTVMAFPIDPGIPIEHGRFAGGIQHLKYDYWGFRCAKRGNDVHRCRVAKRFMPLIELCKRYKNFSFFDKDQRFGNTKLLMITLTYDGTRCNCHEAWLNIGKDLNRFLSSLKQKYGKADILRSFETFKNGYPHVHLIVYFKECDFKVKRFRNKKGKIEWLIPRNDDQRISGFHHSFVKINGIQTVNAVPYVAKYCMKGVFLENNNETLIRCWLYGKRQYSISKSFIHDLMDYLDCDDTETLLDTLMHNSNKSMLSGYDFIYVGIKKIDNVDRNIVRLKPPPVIKNKEGGIVEYSEIYNDHDEWLNDFIVNDCWCSKCGMPLFFDEEKTMNVEKENKIICYNCIN